MVTTYNLPEKSDREADKKIFAELCKATFSEEFAVSKILRLGKKNDKKIDLY